MKKTELTKKEKKLIEELSITKTVREMARVYLSYLTVEEMAKFISTYIVFKSKNQEEKALNYFIKDQFMPLLKTFTLAISDLLPDFVTDIKFMKLYSKLPNKIFFKKD